MIFTGYCIFTDFLHVHGGLIKPSDRKFYHTRCEKENRKGYSALCGSARNAGAGAGGDLLMSAHLSFPLETGPRSDLLLLLLRMSAVREGEGGTDLVFFFVYFFHLKRHSLHFV